MKYAVVMGSGTMIYIPSLINIGSYVQKFIGDEHISTFYFSKQGR
jgi:hypothetical protein